MSAPGLPGNLTHWDEDPGPFRTGSHAAPGRLGEVVKWRVPALIVALFVDGFFYRREGGRLQHARALVAVHRPAGGRRRGAGVRPSATVMSSVVVAPIAAMHPLIAAGWVSGLVEAFSRKPQVRDFERLQEDIQSIRGFWRNNVTRILLVVAFTNLGATVGTLVAFPVIVKILLGGPQ